MKRCLIFLTVTMGTITLHAMQESAATQQAQQEWERSRFLMPRSYGCDNFSDQESFDELKERMAQRALLYKKDSYLSNQRQQSN